MGLDKIHCWRTEDSCLVIEYDGEKGEEFKLYIDKKPEDCGWAFIDANEIIHAGFLSKELVDQLREQLKEE